MQIYLTDAQYRFVKQRAGERGSITGVVRALIDAAAAPAEPTEDPFYRHLLAPKGVSGEAYDAADAKRELYSEPR